MKTKTNNTHNSNKKFTMQCVEFVMENAVILSFVGIMVGNVSALV